MIRLKPFRIPAAIVLALALCALAGCEKGFEVVPYEGNVWMFHVTSNNQHKIVSIQNRFTGNRRTFDTPKEFSDVFPPEPQRDLGALLVTDISSSRTLFALNPDGELFQLDTESQTVVRSLGTGERLRAGLASPGNEFLYLASSGPQTSSTPTPSILIINPATLQAAGSIPLPATVSPMAMALTPDGKYLYVAGELTAAPNGPACQVIDVNSRTLIKTLQFSGNQSRPEIVVSSDGGRAFLTLGNEGVAVIDVLTQTHSHNIPAHVIFGNQHLAIDPAGTALYVAPVRASGSFGVAVFDLATSTLTKQIAVADLDGAMTMAVTADGAYLVIDQIVPDPVTRLNDFPVLKWFSLPSGQLVQTTPWSGSRDTPITPHSLFPVPVGLP
jgi:DNA-binding beta-propeller fold protein YncE